MGDQERCFVNVKVLFGVFVPRREVAQISTIVHRKCQCPDAEGSCRRSLVGLEIVQEQWCRRREDQCCQRRVHGHFQPRCVSCGHGHSERRRFCSVCDRRDHGQSHQSSGSCSSWRGTRTSPTRLAGRCVGVGTHLHGLAELSEHNCADDELPMDKERHQRFCEFVHSSVRRGRAALQHVQFGEQNY